MSFRKTIFIFKSVFHKDDFERVHISNKHHKSHVWSKNLKYIYIYILATLAYTFKAFAWITTRFLHFNIRIGGLKNIGVGGTLDGKNYKQKLSYGCYIIYSVLGYLKHRSFPKFYEKCPLHFHSFWFRLLQPLPILQTLRRLLLSTGNNNT